MIAGYPRAAPGESARVQHYNPLHDATLTSTQEGGTVGAHQTGQHTAPPASSQLQETGQNLASTLAPSENTFNTGTYTQVRLHCSSPHKRPESASL